MLNNRIHIDYMENSFDNMYSDRILVGTILHIAKELMYAIVS